MEGDPKLSLFQQKMAYTLVFYATLIAENSNLDFLA